MESGRASACDPSSHKAFDKAAIGISIGVVEDGQVVGKGLVQGWVVAEIGFVNRLDAGRTSVEDREDTRKREKTDGWTMFVHEKLSRASLCSSLVLPG